MGRYSHLATQPARGPRDILKWKLGARREKPAEDTFETPHRPYDRALVLSGKPSLTWIGHASFLLVLGGLRILIDPILVAGVGVPKRRVEPGIPLGDLTDIDVILVTHNHRDHLDEATLGRILAAHAKDGARLGKKTLIDRPRVVVPAGNGAIMAKLGAGRVDELEWWQQIKIGSVEIMLVPSRHWSMRMPWDRNESLWGGYVIRAPEGVAYHSGDTGFFDGFVEIGRRAEQVDWAMLPIGAYEPRWFMEPQHVCPEEAVKAYDMLQARAFAAMHWGTYKLTDEPLGEPPVRAREAFLAGGRDPDRLWIMDVGETRRL